LVVEKRYLIVSEAAYLAAIKAAEEGTHGFILIGEKPYFLGAEILKIQYFGC
jgi:hypothetical protein